MMRPQITRRRGDMVSLRQKARVLRLLAGRVALGEIAKRTGVHRRAVRKIAKAADLLPPPKPPKPRPPKQPRPPKPEGRRQGVAPWQYSVALAALRSGATCTDAAQHAAISGNAAARIARAHYIAVRPRGRQKGEAGVPLPLRAAALRLVAEGMTLAEAGAQVGVTKQAVHQWGQAEGVKAGKGRKRKTKARVSRPAQEREQPAQLNAKTVVVRGVTLAKTAGMT